MEKIQLMLSITRCRLLLALVAALSLSSCDEVFPEVDDGSGFFDDEKPETAEKIVITKTEFSPDYKTFCLTSEVVSDIGPYAFTDTNSVKFRVRETVDGIPIGSDKRSVLTSVVNVEGNIISKMKIKMLALVDLTLPQSLIDAQKRIITEASTSFINNNLYVSFMYGDYVSESMLATDYVTNNYFVHQDFDYKYLYRSILQKKSEMASREGIWDDASTIMLLVMSDGAVYFDDDQPMDPLHFQLQQRMVDDDEKPDEKLIVQYVNITSGPSPDSDEENVIKVFCKKNHGFTLPYFNWTKIKNRIDDLTDGDIVDNEFYFTNPDFKLYQGSIHHLTLDFYSAKTDSLIASVSTRIRLGSVYDPIIVNGYPLPYVLIFGISIGCFILLLVYLVFQFLIPYIRYKQFLKKYVVSYTNSNMSVGGVMVGQSCYLCKAPYVEGDEVVVKCEHTMHKSCWDENEYHCPEYSDRCKHGSHYYNYNNLFDVRNASFYMRWILAAVVASVLAWTCFALNIHMLVSSFQRWLYEYVLGFNKDSSVAYNSFEAYGVNMYQMPSFGLTISFFLTLAMAVLGLWHRNIHLKWLKLFLRALLASIISYQVFILVLMFVAFIDAIDYLEFFEWIPWTVTGLLIVYSATYGTRIHLRLSLVFLAVMLSTLSLFVWSFIFSETLFDYRVLMLLSYIIFSVGLALCIAVRAPRSNHYYLHTSGAVKEMDIALYKWYRGDAHAVVSIGRSIDCTIQLSWDSLGSIAPVQAELRRRGDAVMLYAIEDGVLIDNRPLEVDKGVPLYHGRSFVIGRTTFTYIEKDL